MHTPRCFLFMLAFMLLTAASMAQAQNQRTLPLQPETQYASSPELDLNRNKELQRYLQSAGVLSQTGPYRIALPIASFGENGPKLLFTYVPRMKDGAGSKVFMFFIRMNLD